ncbi:MAG: immunoglobulin domain-containing protein [Verrucomicrobia bacterium]|nr:immunoglobulin domain-containing protein [Verrucomicrobiota bacterium]
MLRKIFLSALMIQLAAGQALAATVTLQAAADTSLFENSPDANLGAADLAAGTIRLGLKSRALIRFDLADKVPPNATITSAELRIRVNKSPPSGVPSTFGLHRVLQSWGEGSKTGIVGSPATADEATWKARSFPSTLWTAPGASATADYASKASSTRFVAGLGAYTFASTPDLVADVQAWLANPQSNFGWIMISQSEGSPLTARRIASREDPNNGPSLVIQFTEPAQATAPSITVQPQSQSVVAGGTASFSVTAAGTNPLAYQWKFNENDLAGATSATFTLNNVQPANAGAYTVAVSNSAGSVTSAAATLAVTAPATPPAITQQPQSQSVTTGANVTFTVAATGTEPLSFQWKLNGADLPGATSATLTLSNVQSANAGEYAVVITNAAGSATSSTAALTVNQPTPPSLAVSDTAVTEGNSGTINAVFIISLSAPSSQTVSVSFATIDGTATGGNDYQSASGTLTFLPGETNQTIIVQIIGDTVVEPDESFSVSLSNAVNASIARGQASGTILNDDSPLSITTHPQSQTVTLGGTVSFTATAVGSGTLRYQWKFNGADITGATNSTFTLSNVQPSNAGNYAVAVTDSGGSATSALATLTVLVPVTITQQPMSQTVEAGASVTLSISATGTEPLAYQWRFNDAPLPGATGASLVLTNVQPENSGRYIVLVNNPAGTVTSDAAVLTVNPAPDEAPRFDRVERAQDSLNIVFTVRPTYQLALEFTDVLPATTWTTLTNVAAKVSPLSVSVSDAIKPNGQRFYRLKVTGRVR